MGNSNQVLRVSTYPSLACKKEVQKYLIEFILTYSSYDLKSVAELLEIPVLLLSEVMSSHVYLEEEVANKLLDWFFILIGD